MVNKPQPVPTTVSDMIALLKTFPKDVKIGVSWAGETLDGEETDAEAMKIVTWENGQGFVDRVFLIFAEK